MSSRRKFLATLSASLAAAAAGCTDGGGETTTTTEATTSATTTTATTTTTTETTTTETTETTTTTTTATPTPTDYALDGTCPTYMATPGRTGQIADVDGPQRGVGKVWESLVGNPRTAPRPPTMLDGNLFACAGSSVARINPVNGDRDWKHEFDSQITATATVGGDTVYVPTKIGLHALSAETGDQTWQAKQVHTYTAKVGAPVRLEDTVYLVASGSLYAIDAEEGTTQWSAGAAGQGGEVALGAGTAFTASSGGLVAVSLEDGSQRWSKSLARAQSSFPRYSNGAVYVPEKATQSTPKVLAYDVDGEKLWEKTLPDGLRTATITSMAVDDDRLYVGTDVGTMHAYDPADGTTRWRNDLKQGRYYQPTVADGVLYAVNNVDNLIAIDAESGELQFQSSLPTGCYVPPVIEGETAYVANKDYLYGMA